MTAADGSFAISLDFPCRPDLTFKVNCLLVSSHDRSNEKSQ